MPKLTGSLIAALLLAAPAVHADIRVVNRTLLSTTRISFTQFRYTYSVTAFNNGAAAQQVTAKVTSFLTGSTIVSGDLTFPKMAAGATVTSTNTFILDQDRTVALDPNLIRIDFTATTIPVANAGRDQLCPVGTSCLLSGSRSYDPFGRRLTYAWSVVSAPAGSTASIGRTSNAGGRIIFIPDKPGDYLFQLTVNNGAYTSAPSQVKASTVAVAPVADAGRNQSITVPSTVQLDGTGSTNAMQRPITYRWFILSSPAGSNPVLSDVTSPRPTFTATVAGTYQVQLEVTDGPLSSAPAIVTLTTGYTPPYADAGPDLVAFPLGRTAVSAAASSDADGHFLTYRWSVLSGEALALDPVPVPDFLQSESSDYHIQVAVSDGFAESIATVYVATGTGYPTTTVYPRATPAILSPNSAGSSYRLDGSRSITGKFTPQFLLDAQPPDSYSWTMMTKPVGSASTLASPSAATSSFSPDSPGVYVAQLMVGSGYLSEPKTVSAVTGSPYPVANAGQSYYLKFDGPKQFTLNGTASFDASGLPLTYRWTMLNRPRTSAARLSSATMASPTFTADVFGEYQFQLVVSNGRTSSLPSSVVIAFFRRDPPGAGDLSVRYYSNSICVPFKFMGYSTNVNLLWTYSTSVYSWTYNPIMVTYPKNGFLHDFSNVSATSQTQPGVSPLSGISGADTPFCQNPVDSSPCGFRNMCYKTFKPNFTGLDSLTFRVSDLGFPVNCGTPGPMCMAPQLSAPATVTFEIYEPLN